MWAALAPDDEPPAEPAADIGLSSVAAPSGEEPSGASKKAQKKARQKERRAAEGAQEKEQREASKQGDTKKQRLAPFLSMIDSEVNKSSLDEVGTSVAVRLHSLKRADLNDKEGKLVRFIEKSCRWAVAVASEKNILMLAPSTLEVLTSTASSPDGLSQTASCSRSDPLRSLRSLPLTEREEVLRAAVKSNARGCLDIFLNTTGEFDQRNLNFGVLPEASRVLGEELLDVAISKKHPQVLRLLLELGASLHERALEAMVASPQLLCHALDALRKTNQSITFSCCARRTNRAWHWR